MKNRKEYAKIFIGSSEIAGVIVRGAMKLSEIAFGEDSSYYAYLVDENCEIPSAYKMVFETDGWLKIYDDFGLTVDMWSKGDIKIYRCGMQGVIIQVEKFDEYFKLNRGGLYV